MAAGLCRRIRRGDDSGPISKPGGPYSSTRLDLKWEYEPQGFATDGSVPADFAVFAALGLVWAEIKPDWRSTRGRAKWRRFAEQRPQPSRAALFAGRRPSRQTSSSAVMTIRRPAQGRWETTRRSGGHAERHHFDLAFPGLFGAKFAEDGCADDFGGDGEASAAASQAALAHRFGRPTTAERRHDMPAGELHLQLAVTFPKNGKVRRLNRYGRDARALRDLYVQMLLCCKETRSDGFVPDDEIPLLVYPDTEKNGKRDAERLAEVGLLERRDGGWFIEGWFDRNPSREAIEQKSAAKARGARLANHRRWHVELDSPDPQCEWCQKDDQTTDQTTDRSTDQRSDQTIISNRVGAVKRSESKETESGDRVRGRDI